MGADFFRGGGCSGWLNPKSGKIEKMSAEKRFSTCGWSAELNHESAKIDNTRTL
jgi:hypothetical protein